MKSLLWRSPFASGRRLAIARLVFWISFLSFAAWFGRRAWVKNDAYFKNPIVVETRTRFHLWMLSSRSPRLASASWYSLQDIYLRSWRAYHLIAERFLDDKPIHFTIRHKDEPGRPSFVFGTFWASPERFNVYAKRASVRMHDGSYRPFVCSTVGEALLAMAYNEQDRWHTAFNGDWQRWYLENRRYYPLSVRASGMLPEKSR